MPTQNPDYNTQKKTIRKDVNYLGREFSSIRNNLIEFAKSYFPKTYNDFTWIFQYFITRRSNLQDESQLELFEV